MQGQGCWRVGFNQIGRFASTSEDEIGGQGSGGCMQSSDYIH